MVIHIQYIKKKKQSEQQSERNSKFRRKKNYLQKSALIMIFYTHAVVKYTKGAIYVLISKRSLEIQVRLPLCF